MKKLFALILAMVLCFSLCACGGNGDTESVEDKVKHAVKNTLWSKIQLSSDSQWIAVTNVTYNINKKAENKFEVTGKVSISNKDGNTYTGNYKASVEYDSSSDKCYAHYTDCNIGTLTKTTK